MTGHNLEHVPKVRSSTSRYFRQSYSFQKCMTAVKCALLTMSTCFGYKLSADPMS